MNNLEALYDRLAKALAAAINQTLGESSLRRRLLILSSTVEKVAGPSPVPAGPSALDVRGALTELGLALADVLESEEVPAEIWDDLAAGAFIIEDFLQPKNRRRAEAARLRAFVSAWTVTPRRRAA